MVQQKKISGSIEGLTYDGVVADDKDKIALGLKAFVANEAGVPEAAVTITVTEAKLRSRALAAAKLLVTYEIEVLSTAVTALTAKLSADLTKALFTGAKLTAAMKYMKIHGAAGTMAGTPVATAAAEVVPKKDTSNALKVGLSFLTITGAWLL